MTDILKRLPPHETRYRPCDISVLTEAAVEIARLRASSNAYEDATFALNREIGRLRSRIEELMEMVGNLDINAAAKDVEIERLRNMVPWDRSEAGAW